MCDPSYFDGIDFETFPLRKGFTLAPRDDEWPRFILHADGSRLTPEALAPIAQAWLFFGLIIEVLKVSGVSVDIKDLIQCEGEHTHITMRALPKYFVEWEEKERLLSKKDRKMHFRRQQHLITIAMCFQTHQLSGQWLGDSLYWGGRPKESYVVALPFAIEMSIVILTETLDRANRRAFGNLGRMIAGAFENPRLIHYLNEACAWCPSEVSLARQSMDDTLALFASRLDRKRIQGDHSKCSISKCMAFTIDTEQYKTKHDVDCPGCQDIGIDAEELNSILRQGHTPRAYLQLAVTDHTAPIKLTVKDSGPYVAISHVWSDGLGNPNTNSLPICQLLRLHRMAAKLDVGFADRCTAIWIDSLLVPVNKGHEKRLALSRLCDYYQAATKVLVLDSDLLQVSQACTKEELMTRVFLSTWMRRLWTLEEGILSRENLEFQLHDGAVSLSDLGELSDFSTSATTTGSTLKKNMLLWLPKIANYYRRPPNDFRLQHPVIVELLPALEFRSTTKVIDEPLCIAHILGLDASKLVVIDDAPLRMKRLMDLLAEYQALFPMRFLFTKEPKLQLDGFRWAPASFMTLDREDIDHLQSSDDSFYTPLTDKGLLTSGMDSFLLRFCGKTFKKVTYAEVDKRIYAITPVPVGKSCLGAERYWTPESSTEALDVDPACWETEMQAMIGKRPEMTAVVYVGSKGVLVSSYNSEGKPGDPNGSLVYARYISRVYVQELKTESQNYVVMGADSDDIKFTDPTWDFAETEKQMQEVLNVVHDPETSTFLRCRAIDPCQRWCIG